jgi:hypothetical protein
MKKFKDCSKEELDKYCDNTSCAACKLSGTNEHMCIKELATHKDLLSDKALNIELPIDNKILDDNEKEFLTQVVKLYKRMNVEITGFFKTRYCNKFNAITFSYYDLKTKDESVACLRPFDENREMYKGMELNKKYTLEELDIEAPKRKMTIEEFFNPRRKLAIHPGSKKNAKALCKAFDKKGHTWWNEDRYTEHNEYDMQKDETCYDNKGDFDSVDDYEKLGYMIIEFKDVDLK